MVDSTVLPKVYMTSGGDKQVVASGGEVDVESGGAFKLAGVRIVATATEVNKVADVSSFTQAITASGAINLDAKHVTLAVATGTYAATLAAPTSAQAGITKSIVMTDATGTSVTIALTNVVGGTKDATATFDAVGEALVVQALASKWVVLKEYGVTLTS